MKQEILHRKRHCLDLSFLGLKPTELPEMECSLTLVVSVIIKQRKMVILYQSSLQMHKSEIIKLHLQLWISYLFSSHTW